MVSRKKAAAKARKAAKAKARAAVEEEGRNKNQVNDELEQSLAVAAQASRYRTAPAPLIQSTSCQHNVHPLHEGVPSQFVRAFIDSFIEAVGYSDRLLSHCLEDAEIATKTHFPEVWCDSTKMKMVISSFLGMGTHAILEGGNDYARNYALARECATYARFMEQYIAVELHQTEALLNWPKLFETRKADMHTLVKFFRHRIPCSCLNEKYEEVKSITKMGVCFNPQCTLPNGMTARSKTMYCSRCRNITYCSRECQVPDFSRHKPYCDKHFARKAEFEAKQQQNA